MFYATGISSKATLPYLAEETVLQLLRAANHDTAETCRLYTHKTSRYQTCSEKDYLKEVGPKDKTNIWVRQREDKSHRQKYEVVLGRARQMDLACHHLSNIDKVIQMMKSEKEVRQSPSSASVVMVMF